MEPEILPDIFALRSDGAYVSFKGMSESVINEMLAAQGLTVEFITEEEFLANIPQD